MVPASFVVIDKFVENGLNNSESLEGVGYVGTTHIYYIYDVFVSQSTSKTQLDVTRSIHIFSRAYAQILVSTILFFTILIFDPEMDLCNDLLTSFQ
jgi:hypothetical protein